MFVRISGRLRLNAQALNAQGGAGTNFCELSKAKVAVKINDNWVLVEVPAISGNMIKHWHFCGFVDYFIASQYKNNITERALRYNAVRFGKENVVSKPDGTKINLDDEETIIKNFADCDLHGFLSPEKSIRRVSLVKASYIVPTEDFIEAVEGERLIYSVKHNRVDVDEKGKVGSREEETAQMLLTKEYASGLYGFALVLDLGLVGIPEANTKKGLVITEDERKARVECALKALIPMLSGYIGANLARSFPIIKVEELIAIASKDPIPALVNGFYKDYVEANSKLISDARKLKFDIKVFAYNVNLPDAEKVNSVPDLVDKLISMLQAKR